jgi:hypothetical protein
MKEAAVIPDDGANQHLAQNSQPNAGSTVDHLRADLAQNAFTAAFGRSCG